VDVARIARAHGFDLVAVTTGEPLREALEALTAWCRDGHAADLAWMTRDPRQRADPATLLRGVRSVVSVAVAYGERVPAFDAEGRFGRVARYAWGRDYHDVMLPRLAAFAADLARAVGGARTKVACDHSPLLERAAAARGGLGFLGKNTCLLLPRHGSWFLLGEVLLDADLGAPPAPQVAPAAAGCGACTRCLVACPTGAFVAPFVLDARRCISYWTIEHRGRIPSSMRAAMGAWVFGCDVCQEVCPYNGPGEAPVWPELLPQAGVGPRLDLAATLGLADDDAFARRFANTPLLRPGREGLLRNAAIVARNVGALATVPALETCVRTDPSPVVRLHALWALAGLAPGRARPEAERLRADADPHVRSEAEAVLSGAEPS
jgi:epoxyqueuosine reductase